jgi:undecaprenyl-phosphate 4-deoxy-4-formamido-L-arabinose transferase
MQLMKDEPDISVIVPVLNSQVTLKELFVRTRDALSAIDLDFEIIFVDDGSTDNSWKIIRELRAEFAERVRGVRLARNFGQQAATICGLQQARGMWVLTLDDDLQSFPEDISRLWDRAQEGRVDVVYGVYPAPMHDLLHNLGSCLFHRIMRQVAPDLPESSSFRLIRRDLLRSLPTRLGPWVFVDPTLAWLTSDIAIIDVRHERRKHGQSGYSFFKLLSIALTVLVIYSTFPLRIMIWFGFLSAVISFCLGVYYLILKLTTSVAVGFSALIVTMTFGFGVILLSLGILGIYVSRIYITGTGQPCFTIKTEI